MPNAHSYRICCGSKNFRKLWPFGALGWEKHGDPGQGLKRNAAKQVLDMVVDKSGVKRENLFDELRYILPEARAAYPVTALAKLDDERLLIMLTADSCLFLVVVFFILGANPVFPEEHIFFGTGRVKKDMEKWLRSIFFVGNQIPSVVVDKMKSLNYFVELRNEISEKEKPLELLKRSLFEFLTDSQVPKPVDVMDCLRSTILGPSREHLHIWVVGSSDESQASATASTLCKQGYTFEPLPPESGSRGIRCEPQLKVVCVYLPVLEIADEACLELMITSVQDFELLHGSDDPDFQPEATSYFNLLSNLVHTPDDAKVLYSRDVFQGTMLQCWADILNHFHTPTYDPQRCKKKVIRKYAPRSRQFSSFPGSDHDFLEL